MKKENTNCTTLERKSIVLVHPIPEQRTQQIDENVTIKIDASLSALVLASHISNEWGNSFWG